VWFDGGGVCDRYSGRLKGVGRMLAELYKSRE
jgi:hypothetical protein